VSDGAPGKVAPIGGTETLESSSIGRLPNSLGVHALSSSAILTATSSYSLRLPNRHLGKLVPDAFPAMM
jgi:hypothetical protein